MTTSPGEQSPSDFSDLDPSMQCLLKGYIDLLVVPDINEPGTEVAGANTEKVTTTSLPLKESQQYLLDGLLQLIAKSLSCERAYIIRFNNEQELIFQTHEYVVPGATKRMDEYQFVKIRDFAPVYLALQKQEKIIINDINQNNTLCNTLRPEFEVSQTKSLMWWPLAISGKLHGLLGVSCMRKRNWQENEQKFLEIAHRIVTNHISHDIHRSDLERHRDFLTLMLSISSLLVDTEPHTTDTMINEALGDMGEFLKVNRCCIFLLESDNEEDEVDQSKLFWRMTHEWCSLNTTSRQNEFQHAPYDTFSAPVLNILKKNRIFSVHDSALLDDDFRNLKEILNASEMRSVMNVPIFFEKKFKGFIGLSSHAPRKEWEPVESSALKIAGEIFYRVMKSQHDLKQLQASERRYRGVVEDQTECIVRFKPDLIRSFVNSAYCKLLETPAEKLLGKPIGSYLAPVDVERIKTEINKITSENPVVTVNYTVLSPTEKMYQMQWDYRGIYDEQKNLVEYQAVGRDITLLKKAETTLQKRLRFEQLISRINKDFINAPSEEINALITDCLATMSHFLGIADSAIIEFHDTQKFFRCLSRYSIVPVDHESRLRESQVFKSVPLSKTELLRSLIEKGEIVYIEPGQLSENFLVDELLLSRDDGTRQAYYPIVIREQVMGCVAFSLIHPEEWTDEKNHQVELLVQTISHAIDRRRTSEELQLRFEFENLIAAISSEFVNAEVDKIDDIIRDMTPRILDFMQASRCGIIEFFDQNKYAKYICLIEQNVPRPIKGWRVEGTVKPIAEMEMKWLWKEIIAGKKIIIRDVEEYPPEAEVEKKHFLDDQEFCSINIPMLIGEEVVGVLFLGNITPKTWGNELIEELELFTQTIGNAIHRRKMGQELNFRLKIEKLINKLSTKFINLPIDTMSAGIDDALKEIGTLLEVDRSFIYLFDAEEKYAQLKHYWMKESEGQIPPIARVDLESFAWGLEKLRAGEIFSFSNLEEVPPQLTNLKLHYQCYGIKSIYYFPVFWLGELKGVWGFGTHFNERPFKSYDKMVLQFFSNTIGNLMERAENEQRMNNLIHELEIKNSELESFTYTVSHDLKSPLITITGFAGALKEDLELQNKEGIEDDLEEIQQAAEKMKMLLDELLSLSRIGRIKNTSQTMSFSSLVKEILSLYEAQLKEKLLEVQVDENLPNVYGDKVRLLELIQNLVENSIKYARTENGMLEIFQKVDKTGKQIICFKDNGIGIPEKFHRKVFDLFEKLDPRTDGSGIGLAIVKRVVDVHNGEVWIETPEDGVGTIVSVYLPPEATL